MTVTLDDLKVCNLKFNQLPYTSDPEKYGQSEFWEALETDGDCEDFALAKLQRLKHMGLPISQMRLATCFVGGKEEKKNRYHAVLLVDLDQTYILDNRYPYPMTQDQLDYEFHKIQIPGTRDWEWAKGADKSFS